MLDKISLNWYDNSRSHDITIVARSRAVSSAGRAPALQAGCRRFDPVIAHHIEFKDYSTE